MPSSSSYEKFPSVQTTFRVFFLTETFPGPTSNAVMRFLFLSTAVQTRVFKVFLQKYTIHPSPLYPLARDFCDLEAGSLFYPFDYRLIVE